MRAPVSRSRPHRLLPAIRFSFGVTNTPARCERWRCSDRGRHQQRRYGVNRLATTSSAGPPGARGWTGVTRTGVSRRVAELASGSVADQGLKRDVVARPGRRQCHVSVLGTTIDGSGAVTNASNAIMSGWRQVPSVNSTAWHARRRCGHGNREPGPGAQAQIDSSSFEVDIAAHHAPRRLKLHGKLEELLHAPNRDAVDHRPGYGIRPTAATSVANHTDVPHYRTRDIAGLWPAPLCPLCAVEYPAPMTIDSRPEEAPWR